MIWSAYIGVGLFAVALLAFVAACAFARSQPGSPPAEPDYEDGAP